MNTVTSYLERERVPNSIIELMMSHSSNDIYWLRSSELDLLGKYKAGYEEEIIAKCNFNSKEEQSMNAKQWIASFENGVLDCVSDYYSETYGQLRKEAVHKLSQGWRPWSNEFWH